MREIAIAIVVILVIVVFYTISIYNRLVALRHNVTEAWANIDVLLKQRHDELPQLIESCKQYMTHEKDTIDAVTKGREQSDRARATGDTAAIGKSEAVLGTALTQLFARAEAYPDLKAVETFKNLMGRISVLQGSISDRREYFNDSVNLYNIRIEQFPDVMMARMGGFTPKELFKVPESDKEDVDVKSLFNS